MIVHGGIVPVGCLPDKSQRHTSKTQIVVTESDQFEQMKEEIKQQAEEIKQLKEKIKKLDKGNI